MDAIECDDNPDNDLLHDFIPTVTAYEKHRQTTSIPPSNRGRPNKEEEMLSLTACAPVKTSTKRRGAFGNTASDAASGDILPQLSNPVSNSVPHVVSEENNLHLDSSCVSPSCLPSDGNQCGAEHDYRSSIAPSHIPESSPSKEAAMSLDLVCTMEHDYDTATSDQEMGLHTDTSGVDASVRSWNDSKRLNLVGTTSPSFVNENETQPPLLNCASQDEVVLPALVVPLNKELTAISMESIIRSTDQLFLLVEDRETVTLKDMYKSLQGEYGSVKLSKEVKNIVRERLTKLITGIVQPCADDGVDDREAVENSEVEESSVDGDSASEDDNASHTEMAGPIVNRAAQKKKRKRQMNKASNSDSNITVQRREERNRRALAVRVHKENLRQRRLEELRQKNEELRRHQSLEDQKLADSIAAKFDTQTNDQRVARLENRLDLLQKLDRKRFNVMQVVAAYTKETAKPNAQAQSISDGAEDSARQSLEDKQESDASNDSDLEFEDDVAFKSVRLDIHSQNSSAMKLLTLADRQTLTRHASGTSRLGLASKKIHLHSSPGQSLCARAALKSQLHARRRKMGSQWIARALDYKTEEELFQDCFENEKKKMIVSLKEEEKRQATNERKLLRERLLIEDADNGSELPNRTNEGEEFLAQRSSVECHGDDEDEELKLARVLEQEIEKDTDSYVPDDNLGDHDTHEDTDTGPCDLTILQQRMSSSLSEYQISQVEHSCPDNKDKNIVVLQGNKDVSCGVSTPSTAVVSETFSDDATNCMHLNSNILICEQSTDASHELIDGADEAFEHAMKTKAQRNSGWKALLDKDVLAAKKLSKLRGGFVDEEAEEEEEEEVAGLEDFGFTISKKKKEDDDEEEIADDLDQGDLENVVDELSDGEGDEEAGDAARRKMQQQEEKRAHKEMLRRVRDGHDGRRSGIAGGAAGARGVHRFDQLVAADDPEEAKRLNLANDDEYDTDEEMAKEVEEDDDDDDMALLDKLIKDRRKAHEAEYEEENFSADEDENEKDIQPILDNVDNEDIEQEKLARRFSKRARMQRLIEKHCHDEEFSQSRLIDEDDVLRTELSQIKVSAAPWPELLKMLVA
jgi:hypothetical protein